MLLYYLVSLIIWLLCIGKYSLPTYSLCFEWSFRRVVSPVVIGHHLCSMDRSHWMKNSIIGWILFNFIIAMLSASIPTSHSWLYLTRVAEPLLHTLKNFVCSRWLYHSYRNIDLFTRIIVPNFYWRVWHLLQNFFISARTAWRYCWPLS